MNNITNIFERYKGHIWKTKYFTITTKLIGSLMLSKQSSNMT